VFELLKICGSETVDIVRRYIPLLSRQALSQNSPMNSIRWDLTEFNLIVDGVCTWRNNIDDQIDDSRAYCHCILACHVLAFKPNMEVISDKLIKLYWIRR
jgi:hypothetical protein